MKYWFIKLTIFTLLNVIIYVLIASIPVWRYDFKNHTTESNLLVIPTTPNQRHFPLLMMGTSHARIFSRNDSHMVLERILGKSMLNISKGGGHGGLLPEYLFLKYFYNNGNKAETIFYFLDPWVLYSTEWNEENYFLTDEPIDLAFFLSLLKEGVAKEAIMNYLKSKITSLWIYMKPQEMSKNNKVIPFVNEELIKKRVDSLYIDGLNQENFQKYNQLFKRIVTLAHDNGARFVVIIPSTLLGEMPGTKQVRQLTKELGIEFYDASTAIKESKYYYDLDHFNFAGIEIFTEYILKPIYDKNIIKVE